MGHSPVGPRGRRARHQATCPNAGYAAPPPDEREFPDLSPIRPRRPGHGTAAARVTGTGSRRSRVSTSRRAGATSPGRAATAADTRPAAAARPSQALARPARAKVWRPGSGSPPTSPPASGTGPGQTAAAVHGSGQHQPARSVRRRPVQRRPVRWRYGRPGPGRLRPGGLAGPGLAGAAAGQAVGPAGSPGHRLSLSRLSSPAAAARAQPGSRRRTCRPGPSPTRWRRSRPGGTGAASIPATTGARTGASAAGRCRGRRRGVVVIAVAVYFLFTSAGGSANLGLGSLVTSSCPARCSRSPTPATRSRAPPSASTCLTRPSRRRRR